MIQAAAPVALAASHETCPRCRAPQPRATGNGHECRACQAPLASPHRWIRQRQARTSRNQRLGLLSGGTQVKQTARNPLFVAIATTVLGIAVIAFGFFSAFFGGNAEAMLELGGSIFGAGYLAAMALYCAPLSARMAKDKLAPFVSKYRGTFLDEPERESWLAKHWPAGDVTPLYSGPLVCASFDVNGYPGLIEFRPLTLKFGCDVAVLISANLPEDIETRLNHPSLNAHAAELRRRGFALRISDGGLYAIGPTSLTSDIAQNQTKVEVFADVLRVLADVARVTNCPLHR